MDYYQESLDEHRRLGGKMEIASKMPLKDKHDLSVAYTPGVAEPCRAIHRNPDEVWNLTIKKNSVAVVTDGSAVLGLGNIGAEAGLPVMEGKALLFKEFGNIDAYPICIKSQKAEDIIFIVKNIAPGFGGINLEDISAPRCFEIENALQDIGIPVFHDDQHGTAIVTVAALINAAKLRGTNWSDLKVVINGAGAAGTAVAQMLLGIGYDSGLGAVADVILCDTKGAIYLTRPDLVDNPAKLEMARVTNKQQVKGDLADALKDMDVFIGLSVANVVTEAMVKRMAKRPLIFAMSNPTPEIMPDLATRAGAYIVATGRSDFPNQVNNVLAFPAIFRGALDARAPRITNNMKMAAAIALADAVQTPHEEYILPSPLDKGVAKTVAKAVREMAEKEFGSTC